MTARRSLVLRVWIPWWARAVLDVAIIVASHGAPINVERVARWTARRARFVSVTKG